MEQTICVACESGDCGPLVRVLEDGSHLHHHTDDGYCTHEPFGEEIAGPVPDDQG